MYYIFGKKKASGINNNACTQSIKRELGQKFNDRGNETVKVKEMNFYRLYTFFVYVWGKKEVGVNYTILGTKEKFTSLTRKNYYVYELNYGVPFYCR